MRYIGYLFFQATSSMHIKSINPVESSLKSYPKYYPFIAEKCLRTNKRVLVKHPY